MHSHVNIYCLFFFSRVQTLRCLQGLFSKSGLSNSDQNNPVNSHPDSLVPKKEFEIWFNSTRRNFMLYIKTESEETMMS